MLKSPLNKYYKFTLALLSDFNFLSLSRNVSIPLIYTLIDIDSLYKDNNVHTHSS